MRGRKDAYDKALKDVDILVMPTVAQPPKNLGDEGAIESPLEGNNYLPGVIYNTCPFDSMFSDCNLLHCHRSSSTH